MTLMWAAVVVSFVALASLVAYLRRHSRTKLFGAREDAEHEHTEYPVRRSFSNDCRGNRHPPRSAQASDRFSEIFKVDSWLLGGAQDAIEDLIRKKTAYIPPPLATIQDLLNWLSHEQ
jgi:hypothetical protein